MRHADDGLLHAYLDGELRSLGEDPAALEHHLIECARCAARLEEARRLREQARALLGSAAPVERPPFEAVLARARGGPAPVTRGEGVGPVVRRGGSVPAMRRRVSGAVWAASVVLALAGGWLARGLLPSGDPAADGGGVRVASSPAPAPAPAPASARPGGSTAGADTPAVDAAEPALPSGRIVETEPRSQDPEPFAAAAAPPLQRRESEPPVEPDQATVHQAGPGSVPAPVQARPQAAGPGPLAARVPSTTGEEARIGRIEGTVMDESGGAVAGAIIQVRGTALGTLTGPDGTYSLAVPEDSLGADDGPLMITARALGWEHAEATLSPARGRSTTQDFLLHPSRVALEGIVATGRLVERGARPEAESFEVATGAGRSSAWQDEIRRLLGRDALRIAGVPVVETAIGMLDGIPTVRVRQELPGGAVVTLLQWRDADRRDAGSAAAAFIPPLASGESEDGGLSEATAWREGVRVVARAPLSADVLAQLLETLE